MALLIPSVELIIGLVGSTIGVAICIMFPAASFRQIIKKESTERSLTQLIIVSGFCLMILGTYANLNAIDEQRSGAHLEEMHLEDPTQLPPVLKMELTLDSAPQFKKEAELLVQQIQKDLEKKEEAQEKLSPPEPAPVLPVDEKHEQSKVDKVVEKKEEVVANKMQAISPMPDRVLSPKIIPKEEVKPELPEKMSSKLPIAPLPSKELPTNSSSPPQAINNEAIKKDEEIFRKLSVESHQVIKVKI